MQRHHRSILRLIMLAATVGSAHASSWTGAANNGLWFDAANWDGGVPIAGQPMNIFATTPTNISLGGQVGEASWMSFSSLSSASLTINNGSLRTTILSGGLSTQPITLNVPIELIGGPNAPNASINGIMARGVVSASAIDPPTFLSISFSTFAAGSRLQATNLRTSASTFALGSTVSANQIAVSSTVFAGLTPSGDQISDNAELSFEDGNGTVTFTGNGGASSERIKRLNSLPGLATVVQNGNDAVTLHFDSIGLADGAAFSWKRTGIAAANHRLLMDVVPTLLGGNAATGVNRGVALWAIDAGLSNVAPQLLTYDTGTDLLDPSDDVGLRTLDVQNEFVQGISNGVNNRIATSTAVSGTATPKVLSVEGSTTLSIPAAAAVEINDGVLALTGVSATPRVSGDGTLRFTGQSTILALGSSNTPVINVPITASSLSVVLQSSLQLDRVNAIGTLTLNGQQGLKLNAVDALPGTTIGMTGSGATVQILQGGTYTFNADGTQKLLRITGPSTPITLSGNLNVGSLSTIGTITLPNGLLPNTRSLAVGTGQTTVAQPVNLTALQIAGSNGLRDSTTGKAIVSGTINTLTLYDTGILDIGPGIASLSVLSFDRQDSAFPPVTSGPLGNLVFDVSHSAAGTTSDSLTIAAFAVSLGSIGTPPPRPFNIDLVPAAGLAVGDSFTLIQLPGATPFAGLYGGVAQGAVFTDDGVKFQVNYFAGDGNDLAVIVVPEPVSAASVAVSALLLRRRSRS